VDRVDRVCVATDDDNVFYLFGLGIKLQYKSSNAASWEDFVGYLEACVKDFHLGRSAVFDRKIEISSKKEKQQYRASSIFVKYGCAECPCCDKRKYNVSEVGSIVFFATVDLEFHNTYP
jgi:hypothetical protein